MRYMQNEQISKRSTTQDTYVKETLNLHSTAVSPNTAWCSEREFKLRFYSMPIMDEGFINVTIGAFLDQLEVEYPDRLAVKYTDRDYTRTWAEFNHEVEQVAKGFMSMGLGKDDHIAIWATNIPEWLLTFFACTKIGAVLVTVNTSYKLFEAEYLLRQSDAACVVISDGFKDSDYKQIMHQLVPQLKDSEPGKINCPKLPHMRLVVHAGNDDSNTEGMLKFSDLKEQGTEYPQDKFLAVKNSLDPHEVVNMQYTSGTTGFPKGVMLSHYNVINNGKAIGDCMKFTPEDRLCITVPFFHCFGMVLAITACFTHASAMFPIEVFSPIKVLETLQNEKCTAVHGVPTMFIAELEHPQFSSFTFPALRTGIMAGSPCPIKVMQDVVDKMGMHEIVITYGQTEASPGCTMTTTTDSLEKRVSTVGKAMPDVETKIIDPNTGETLGANVPGEFCARGYNIMKGYYNMPEATAMAIDDEGWLHTGDLAMVDEEGYYKITGRLKDMIIRGGENIYPKEIEEFFYTLPQVKDVQVIGIPSAAYGEEVMACVILKAGIEITPEELREEALKSMARHKVPRYIKFVDSFPMTASGKIQKYLMREQAIEELHLEDAASIVTA